MNNKKYPVKLGDRIIGECEAPNENGISNVTITNPELLGLLTKNSPFGMSVRYSAEFTNDETFKLIGEGEIEDLSIILPPPTVPPSSSETLIEDVPIGMFETPKKYAPNLNPGERLGTNPFFTEEPQIVSSPIRLYNEKFSAYSEEFLENIDLNRTLELFNSFGIEFKELKTKDEYLKYSYDTSSIFKDETDNLIKLIVVNGHGGKVNGYRDFITEFRFHLDGSFDHMGSFEV